MNDTSNEALFCVCVCVCEFIQLGMFGITGTIENVWNYTVIKSLRFYSNRTKYGPYGDERGESFSFPMEGGAIVGFHGRSGALLDAIGVCKNVYTILCFEPRLQNAPKGLVVLASQTLMFYPNRKS